MHEVRDYLMVELTMLQRADWCAGESAQVRSIVPFYVKQDILV